MKRTKKRPQRVETLHIKRRRKLSRRKVSVLGRRIRERREHLDMTLRALAIEIGRPHQHISRLETGLGGRWSVEAQLVAKLAVALATSTDWLLGLTDDPVPRHRLWVVPKKYRTKRKRA